MSKGPIALVKDQFGDKKKLVAAVEALADGDLWLGRTASHKGLAHVSNAKLLKLHATFGAVKEKFGTRGKLVAAVLEMEKRAKDEGYKTRLESFPVPRLWDLYKSAEKRSGAKAAKAAGTKTAKTAQAGVAVQPRRRRRRAAAQSGAAKKSGGQVELGAAKKGAAKKAAGQEVRSK